MQIRAKKHLGQHFLKDTNIAKKIVDSLTLENYDSIIEIGHGMGVLTQYLLEIKDINFKCVDIDESSVEYLKENMPIADEKIIFGGKKQAPRQTNHYQRGSGRGFPEARQRERQQGGNAQGVSVRVHITKGE